MWIIFEVYYKHGEWEVSTFDTDEEMREYCLAYLRNENSESSEDDDNETEESDSYNEIEDSDSYNNIEDSDVTEDSDESQEEKSSKLKYKTLEELVSLTMIEGERRIEKQEGMGVVKIIKGNNITLF